MCVNYTPLPSEPEHEGRALNTASKEFVQAAVMKWFVQ